MSYNYRTRTDQIKIHLNSIQNTAEKLVGRVKENAYHYGLMTPPEVNWVDSLPAPGETSYQ